MGSRLDHELCGSSTALSKPKSPKPSKPDNQITVTDTEKSQNEITTGIAAFKRFGQGGQGFQSSVRAASSSGFNMWLLSFWRCVLDPLRMFRTQRPEVRPRSSALCIAFKKPRGQHKLSKRRDACGLGLKLNSKPRIGAFVMRRRTGLWGRLNGLRMWRSCTGDQSSHL